MVASEALLYNMWFQLNDAIFAIYPRELQSIDMGIACNFFESGGASLKPVCIVALLCRLHKEHNTLLLC